VLDLTWVGRDGQQLKGDAIGEGVCTHDVGGHVAVLEVGLGVEEGEVVGVIDQYAVGTAAHAPVRPLDARELGDGHHICGNQPLLGLGLVDDHKRVDALDQQSMAAKQERRPVLVALLSSIGVLWIGRLDLVSQRSHVQSTTRLIVRQLQHTHARHVPYGSGIGVVHAESPLIDGQKARVLSDDTRLVPAGNRLHSKAYTTTKPNNSHTEGENGDEEDSRLLCIHIASSHPVVDRRVQFCTLYR